MVGRFLPGHAGSTESASVVELRKQVQKLEDETMELRILIRAIQRILAREGK